MLGKFGVGTAAHAHAIASDPITSWSQDPTLSPIQASVSKAAALRRKALGKGDTAALKESAIRGKATISGMSPVEIVIASGSENDGLVHDNGGDTLMTRVSLEPSSKNTKTDEIAAALSIDGRCSHILDPVANTSDDIQSQARYKEVLFV